jgi:hypothetical protein
MKNITFFTNYITEIEQRNNAKRFRRLAFIDNFFLEGEGENKSKSEGGIKKRPPPSQRTDMVTN